MVSENVCTADVPPRWAFVCGLLRRYVWQCGVQCSFFLFWAFSLGFFIFFVVVKTAFFLLSSYVLKW